MPPDRLAGQYMVCGAGRFMRLPDAGARSSVPRMEKRPWALAGPPLTLAGIGIAIRFNLTHPHWSTNLILGVSAVWLTSLAVDWYRSRRASSQTPSGPRRLTEKQSAQIVQALHATTGHIIICSYAVAPDSHDLAEDFAAVFRKVGWKADVSMQPTKPRIAPPTGIAIELPGDQAPQPDPKMTDAQLRSLLGDAMVAAGISVNIRHRTEIWNYAQCCMIVGARPNARSS